MNFPGPLTAETFLQQYWQKQALRMPRAIPHALPTLSADELGWLATLDDVESRLVFTERTGDKISYRVEHGPFANEELENLPQQDWTLLIQDVEKHLPDFRAYLDLIDFVPDWRIDDLMVSFAAPGGSVGPHLDNYDVFLCQGSGTRIWQLAEPGSVAPDSSCEAMSLLEEFRDESPMVAENGDILYLPPGVPHWGIADTACLTYSIGMRAPTQAELLCHLDDAAAMESAAENEVFYQDPNLGIDEAVPGLIGKPAIDRVKATLGADHPATDKQLTAALGVSVTEPKPWLIPATMSSDEAIASLATHDSQKELVVHGMARLAYSVSDDAITVFANGACLTTAGRQSVLVRELCKERRACPQSLQQAREDEQSETLLLWLGQQGVFDL